jgi:hypothetical protein
MTQKTERSLQALLQGLQDFGWKPGIDLQIDIRYRNGQPERIAAVAKELVAAQPDVLEVETTPGTAAVLKETHTIFLLYLRLFRPSRSRLYSEPVTSRRQRHRVHKYRVFSRRQMASASQVRGLPGAHPSTENG